jgi:ribose transport system ATP-binding protein
VGDLPFAYRQMTEIAKALLGDVGALILDEPTSALTAGEEVVLFDAVHRVTSRGVGVVYVTHRLDEVFRIADRATVFRDGRNVGTWSTTEIDLDGIVTAIIGSTAAQGDTATQTLACEPAGGAAAAPSAQVCADRSIPDRMPALEMIGVTNAKLKGLHLTVHAGEIVGLVGLMGAGRTEILETVFGLRRTAAGTIAVCGTAGAPHDPRQAIARGVAMVPEDRHVQGLLLHDSIERNLALPRLRQLSRAGFLSRRDAKRRAREAIRTLGIKAPNGHTTVSALSGGNQQKVVFGKWREPDPAVLLLDEPTVGVDVGGREEIYDVIRAAAAAGTAVLVASSDFRELLLIAQRLDLVVDGRIVDSVDRRHIRSEQQLHQWVQSAMQSATDTEPPVTASTPA